MVAQWILAYDGGCGRCWELAEQVQKLAGDRLGVRDLREAEVAVWRRAALGLAAA